MASREFADTVVEWLEPMGVVRAMVGLDYQR